MDRREFIKVVALFAASAAAGAIGGITAEEDGQWGEDDEPPSKARAGEEQP